MVATLRLACGVEDEEGGAEEAGLELQPVITKKRKQVRKLATRQEADREGDAEVLRKLDMESRIIRSAD